jgi:hypothetical protein
MSAPVSGGKVIALPSINPAAKEEDDIAPSRAMEYWLFGIMTASLAVSISGLAFVYGFDLAHPFSPSNISPGVRGIIVDSVMFLGVYFTRRFLMHQGKQTWHWFWGSIWLLVAVLATGFSWFSNTLAVNALGTVVTQGLLNKAGFGDWDAAGVNQVIAALPIVAVLLYAIVPRRMKAAPRVVDTRTPEEILHEAQQEAARIQAGRMLRQARAEEVGEGLGDGISALTRGVNTALGRDPRAAHAAKVAREEALRQMRVLLLRHGWVESLDKAMKMKPEQIRLLAETKKLWDPATNQPASWALLPTESEKRADLRKLALAHQWLTAEEVAQEDEMGYAALQARYAELELRAEEARRQEEAQRLIQPADPDREAPDTSPQMNPAPLAAAASAPAPVDGEAKRDGFTPAELGKRPGGERSGGGGDTRPEAAPEGSDPDEDYEDWLTVDEFAEEFHIAPATVGYWSRPDASGPKKIYQQEQKKKLVGNKTITVISPVAAWRIRKSLSPKNSGTPAQRHLKKGDSQGKLSVVSANGNHLENG